MTVILTPTARAWLHEQVKLAFGVRGPIFDVRRESISSIVIGATRFYGLSDQNRDSLVSRLQELPHPSERGTAAVVAANEAEFDVARSLLMDNGYKTVHDVSIEDIAHVNPEIVAVLADREVIPSRALWRPSPGLVQCLQIVVDAMEVSKRRRNIKRFSALDIGSGCGRDAAYLAHHGWNVTAVDRDPELIARAVRLGNRGDQTHNDTGFELKPERHGHVKGLVRTFGSDHSKDAAWFRANAADLVLVVRFLRRGVLESLHHAVQEGGFLFYEHFLVGSEKLGGPRKRSQMLDRDELPQLFNAAKGFTVLLNTQHILPDGRPIIRFLAHKDSDAPPAESLI